MKYKELGRTGYKVSAIGYGGIVSSQHFDEAFNPGDGQKMSDQYVSWAIEHGINSPGYSINQAGHADMLNWFDISHYIFYLSTYPDNGNI